MLLAALTRMASGENEGLHGVGETSRVSKQWLVHGEAAVGTAQSTLSLCRFLPDTGNGSVVPFERIICTTFKVYLTTLSYLAPVQNTWASVELALK